MKLEEGKEDDQWLQQILLVPEEPDPSALHVVQKSIATTCKNSVSANVQRSIGACCQVEIHIRPGHTTSILYSRDCHGRRKSTGGDEFYVRYEERMETPERIGDPNDEDSGGTNSSTQLRFLQAVALVTDKGDGSYELEFSTTPMHPCIPPKAKRGETLSCNYTVYIEYTNGIGFLPPPSKNDWENGGYTHKMYQTSAPSHWERPKIRQFLPPSLPAEVHLDEFDQVFVFGDSTFCQFVRQRPNKKGKYYFQPNLCVLGEKVRVGLNTETVSVLLELLEESNVNSVLSRSSADNNKKKALIVGSCLWDMLSSEDTIQGAMYENHAQACREYILGIQARYPSVTVLWKSPMACHIHWVDLQRVVEHDRATATLFGVNRIRYMSASRSWYLYQLQKKIMNELKVPFLDIYEATYLSSDLLYPSDGRHYKPDLNRKMLSWFYKNHYSSKNNGQKYFKEVVL